jgi:hypothetical protein
MNEDPITSDGVGIAPGNLGIDDAIWDPREYFLRIMDARIKQILTEGSCIVRKVEKSVDQEVRSLLLPLRMSSTKINHRTDMLNV